MTFFLALFGCQDAPPEDIAALPIAPGYHDPWELVVDRDSGALVDARGRIIREDPHPWQVAPEPTKVFGRDTYTIMFRPPDPRDKIAPLAWRELRAAVRAGDKERVRDQINAYVRVRSYEVSAERVPLDLLSAAIMINDDRFEQLLTQRTTRRPDGAPLYNKVWFRGATPEDKARLRDEALQSSLPPYVDCFSPLNDAEACDLALLLMVRRSENPSSYLLAIKDHIETTRFKPLAEVSAGVIFYSEDKYELALKLVSPWTTHTNSEIQRLAETVTACSISNLGTVSSVEHFALIYSWVPYNDLVKMSVLKSTATIKTPIYNAWTHDRLNRHWPGRRDLFSQFPRAKRSFLHWKYEQKRREISKKLDIALQLGSLVRTRTVFNEIVQWQIKHSNIAEHFDSTDLLALGVVLENPYYERRRRTTRNGEVSEHIGDSNLASLVFFSHKPSLYSRILLAKANESFRVGIPDVNESLSDQEARVLAKLIAIQNVGSFHHDALQYRALSKLSSQKFRLAIDLYYAYLCCTRNVCEFFEGESIAHFYSFIPDKEIHREVFLILVKANDERWQFRGRTSITKERIAIPRKKPRLEL